MFRIRPYFYIFNRKTSGVSFCKYGCFYYCIMRTANILLRLPFPILLAKTKIKSREEKLREIMHLINFFFSENIKCNFYIFMSRIIYYYDDLIQFEILRNQQENSVKHDFTNILIESYNFLRRFHIKK